MDIIYNSENLLKIVLLFLGIEYGCWLIFLIPNFSRKTETSYVINSILAFFFHAILAILFLAIFGISKLLQ